MCVCVCILYTHDMTSQHITSHDITLRDTLTVSPSDALRVNRHDPVGYGATGDPLIKWDSTIKPWIKHELVYLQMG